MEPIRHYKHYIFFYGFQISFSNGYRSKPKIRKSWEDQKNTMTHPYLLLKFNHKNIKTKHRPDTFVDTMVDSTGFLIPQKGTLFVIQSTGQINQINLQHSFNELMIDKTKAVYFLKRNCFLVESNSTAESKMSDAYCLFSI